MMNSFLMRLASRTSWIDWAVAVLVTGIVFLLVGCGPMSHGPRHQPGTPPVWDDALVPSMVTFVNRMQDAGVFAYGREALPIRMTFRTMPRGVAAACDPRGPEIWVDPYYHNESAALKLLVAHELMHCVYDIAGHDGTPGHIFSEFVPDDYWRWKDERWEREWARLALIAAEVRE